MQKFWVELGLSPQFLWRPRHSLVGRVADAASRFPQVSLTRRAKNKIRSAGIPLPSYEPFSTHDLHVLNVLEPRQHAPQLSAESRPGTVVIDPTIANFQIHIILKHLRFNRMRGTIVLPKFRHRFNKWFLTSTKKVSFKFSPQFFQTALFTSQVRRHYKMVAFEFDFS